MNNIQKLINETKAGILLAEIQIKKTKNKKVIEWYNGYISANKNHIVKLTLLLNTENENGGKNEASNGGKPM